MTPQKRLLVAGCLFVCWIGYLVYLVSITRNPVILSRPQFLVADVYVLADLDVAQKEPTLVKKTPNKKVHVREVRWAADEAARGLAGKDIPVEGLDKCEAHDGWTGAGGYILPLSKNADGVSYRLTEIPYSPGFHHDPKTLNYLRIYRATPQARTQLTSLIEEFHP